jgi:hypothetical protein
MVTIIKLSIPYNGIIQKEKIGFAINKISVRCQNLLLFLSFRMRIGMGISNHKPSFREHNEEIDSMLLKLHVKRNGPFGTLKYSIRIVKIKHCKFHKTLVET